MRSQALDKAARRIVWLRFAGLGMALVLSGRAAHLTVAHTRALQLYKQQIQTEQRLAPARGTIFDRNGRELAISTEAASIYAVPKLMNDRAAAAEQLAEILGLDPARLATRFAERERFTYVARWVETEKAARIEALDLKGVGIDAEPRRTYPAGKLAAPVLGFANIDGKGVRGIEQIENEWLVGQQRRVQVERDARGRALALRSTDPRGTSGGEIALTIDAAMQGAAEAALADAVAEHDAVGGLILTLDPKNGDILSLVEAPGFDPNQFRQLDYRETRARSFTDVVEAGSTMKVFLIASAIEAGLIDASTQFDTGEGWMRVRGKTIRDAKPHGVIQTADILRVSSNVGAVQVAQLLGREAQYRGLLRFGFGSSTRSGFPTESAGLVRDWPRWKPVDQATVSFGQGISVTPIQLASALGALANGGERMRPRLVMARRRGEAPWQPTEIKSVGYAVSPEAARATLDMMTTVVAPNGTGRLAGLSGLRVAGKTGTAQKFDTELGTYSQDRYMAWFVGVVPAENPELAIVVAVDEPMGASHSGGGVAAPLFARVAAAQLARRGIHAEPEPIPRPAAPQLLAAPRTNGPVTAEVASPSEPVQPPLEFQMPEAEIVSATAPELVPDDQFESLRATVAAPPARPAADVAAGPPSPPEAQPVVWASEPETASFAAAAHETGWRRLRGPVFSRRGAECGCGAGLSARARADFKRLSGGDRTRRACRWPGGQGRGLRHGPEPCAIHRRAEP